LFYLSLNKKVMFLLQAGGNEVGAGGISEGGDV
jgi:hypothetical protein